jgi:6-phosphofructokinase 1
MKRIAVITAGGDAPGMNAAIRAVVRSALAHDLEVIGFERGYQGLIEDQYRPLGSRSVSGIINRGGTILRTVRSPAMKTREGIEQAIQNLAKHQVDGLITIGGDGTFRGACRIHDISNIPVIGIPATIDNDVAGTETTIGFDTAVNTALDAIDKIRDTATSHERIFIVEVMGRTRGFLALEVGLAGGAEIILVPEAPYEMSQLCKRLQRDYDLGKRSEILVMAEGAGDSHAVTSQIQKEMGHEVRLTILGHIQRGGRPTARSRTIASEFGNHAVNQLLVGSHRHMVGLQRGRIVSVKLDVSWKVEKPLDLERYQLAEVMSL